ncbi:gamma-glutamyltransferase [Phenylobacterium sp.]|uniref:gamma-glutamyltransferase n=1 Tax=Phenylobacterium sp. TaxID=1871053 RepID=UPI003BA8E139
MSRPTPTVVTGQDCLVTSGSVLATKAGLETLASGGSAFDAAVTVASCLMVALPMSCGLGGDLVFMGFDAAAGTPIQHAFLGRAPAHATPANVARGGSIPLHGILAATIPAAAEGLLEFHRRYARRPLRELLHAARSAADDGLRVSPQFSRWTSNNLPVVLASPALSAIYAPDGDAVTEGSLLLQAGLGVSLGLMAERSAAVVLAELRQEVLRLSAQHGGLFSAADLHESQELLSPALTFTVGSRQLLTPNLPTQGYMIGQSLNAFAAVTAQAPAAGPAEEIHVWTEIFNQIYGLRLAHLADPEVSPAATDVLCADAVSRIAAAVDRRIRTPLRYRNYYDEGDTTQFVVKDAAGNLVSGIMSLSHGFGCGVSSATYGLTLSNRLGRSSTADPRQANCVGPRKRPVNTIMTYLVMEDGAPFLAGGTPGGDGQAQWNSVFLADVLLHGHSPEIAIARPRFTLVPGADKGESAMAEGLEIETGYGDEVYDELRSRGHTLKIKPRVQGALRSVAQQGGQWIAVDDGHEEGLTAAAPLNQQP